MRGVINREGEKWVATADFGTGPDGRRKRVQKTFDLKREAADWLNEVGVQAAHGITAEATRTTVGSYLESWLEGHALEVRPSTLSWYESTFRNHVKPRIGGMQLRAVTPDALRVLYAALAPATARRVHVLLRRALSDAAGDGLIVRNPAALVKKPKAVLKRPPLWWRPEELAAFLEAVETDRLFAAWRLLGMSGMRRGEVLGLFWRDIDWEKRTLTIERSFGPKNEVDEVTGGARTGLGIPKTKSSYRTIDLDDETLSILRKHRKAQVAEQLLAGEIWHPGEFVFTDCVGLPLEPRNFSKAFRSLVHKAGARRIRLHELRDSHGSHLVIAGVHPKVVMERLGHSSMGVTLGLYAHVMPSMGRDAARIAAALVAKKSPKNLTEAGENG